jgi:hypothetical protein
VNDDISQGPRPWPRSRAAILAAVAGGILLTAACSGAQTAAGGSASSSAGAARPSAGDSGGSSSAPRAAPSREQLAYSECMRKHGVPGVPTSLPSVALGPPKSNNPDWKAGAVSGPSPGSPQFLAAQQACRRLVPAPSWVPG